MPPAVRQAVELIAENCEPALTTVLFVGGAGGSLRAGATRSPVRLTQAIKDSRVNVTCGGAPVYVWPGGGITVMVDVALMPDRSFGTVPTPAVVAPIEFTMRLSEYQALGGYMESVQSPGGRDESASKPDREHRYRQSLAAAAQGALGMSASGRRCGIRTPRHGSLAFPARTYRSDC